MWIRNRKKRSPATFRPLPKNCMWKKREKKRKNLTSLPLHLPKYVNPLFHYLWHCVHNDSYHSCHLPSESASVSLVVSLHLGNPNQEVDSPCCIVVSIQEWSYQRVMLFLSHCDESVLVRIDRPIIVPDRGQLNGYCMILSKKSCQNGWLWNL